MSAKWIRSKQWDRQHLTGWLTPVRIVLHAFSTVWMAVVLLGLLAVYGILASIPIGMLALIPTVAVYALTLVLAVLVVAVVPTWLLWRAVRSAGGGFATRFAVGLPVLIALLAVAGVGWYWYLWPVLHYDPITGGGVRFFAGFVEQYKAETLRRLPVLEMSELEFYAWWPVELLLVLFIINMVVTTVRRIEFSFVNIGVLTVHTGIVAIAIGSVYYASFKQEGDTLLLAGVIDPATGRPGVGPVENGFYDNTKTVLRVRQLRTAQQKIDRGQLPGAEWEQRLLRGVPRYNAYNLGAVESAVTPGGVDLGDQLGDQGRRLSLEVPSPARDGLPGLVDEDIELRVVGYAPYAELVESWRPGGDGSFINPVRFVELLSGVGGDGSLRRIEAFGLASRLPAQRVGSLGDAISIESFERLPKERWEELLAPLPAGAQHGLIVEVPGAGLSRVYGVAPGQTIEIGGYTLVVEALSPEPPLPIITPGYRGATSSVAVVRVRTPGGEVFSRYVYSRLPELNQDLVAQGAGADGQALPPKRRVAEGSIRLTYIDGSRVQVYLDETGEVDDKGNAIVRGLVRVPGRPAAARERLIEGDRIDLGPMAAVRIGGRLASAERVGVPRVVPAGKQEKDNIGTHRQAKLAVQVRVPAKPGSKEWSRTLWVPFQQYSGLGGGGPEGAVVRLGDGRELEIVFGRLWRALPGMGLALKDFEMIPYAHSEQPRDFRSDLIVHKFGPGGTIVQEEAMTSLNEPLLESPFTWRDENGLGRNVAGWLATKLGPAQYKFSQNGWDPTGWNQSKEQLAGGQGTPSARFTILGVGNNPGIYVIAMGGILMSLGIPWAFYGKPWLVRRKKARLMAELAAGGKLPGQRGGQGGGTKNGSRVVDGGVSGGEPVSAPAEVVR